MRQTDLIYSHEKLAEHIELRLRVCGLSDAQIETVLPKLTTHHEFILNKKGFLDPASSSFDYKTKIEETANLLKPEGLTPAAFLQAALKQPQLFYQSPATIAANIRGTAELLKPEGLTPAAFLQAVLKQPSLFYQSPVTVAEHIRLMIKAMKLGIISLPDKYQGIPGLISWLIGNPAMMTLASQNIRSRFFYAVIAHNRSKQNILTIGRSIVEKELHTAFKDAKAEVTGQYGEGVIIYRSIKAGQPRKLRLQNLMKYGMIRAPKG